MGAGRNFAQGPMGKDALRLTPPGATFFPQSIRKTENGTFDKSLIRIYIITDSADESFPRQLRGVVRTRKSGRS